MIVALIDNGSLEPAATRNLRAVAAALSVSAGLTVHAVSWKHSDRLPAADLDGVRAVTLASFVRTQLAQGERDFLFVPFFVSAQGAIGSALRADLEKIARESDSGSFGFSFTFTDGLAARGAIAEIVAARIRETITTLAVRAPHQPPVTRPSVIVVDHGGPSPASATLRDQLAAEVRTLLGSEVGPLTAASMEGAEHAHNRPLLADALAAPGFDRGDVVIAPLFLSPGRHAGPKGDLAQIARAAETSLSTLRCHFTELVGTHPRAAGVLAEALRAALARHTLQPL